MAETKLNSIEGFSVGPNSIAVIDNSANITAVAITANGNVSFTGANVSLGNVSNLHITGGNANQVLSTDGTGNISWVDGGGGNAIVTISTTAPTSPVTGELWWDSDDGNSYIRYDDGTSNQWVLFATPAATVGATGAAGPSTVINATDDTSTSTLYPVMVGAAGSDQTPKVTTSKLTFNASTGQLSATDLNSTSDERLKENIVQITDALEKVLKLRGVSYTLKETGSKKIGVIAQEVEQIIPEVIGTMDDTKTVSYGNMIGLLIEAIKELKQEIEDLKKDK